MLILDFYGAAYSPYYVEEDVSAASAVCCCQNVAAVAALDANSASLLQMVAGDATAHAILRGWSPWTAGQ